MSLPRSVICLKVHFLMQIQDILQNSFFPYVIEHEAMQAQDNTASEQPPRLGYRAKNYSDLLNNVL